MPTLRYVRVVKHPSPQSIPPQPMSGYALPIINKTRYTNPVNKVNHTGLIFGSVFNPVFVNDDYGNKIHASGYFTDLKNIKRSWSLYTNNNTQINIVYYSANKLKTIKNVGSTFGLLSFLKPFKITLNALQGTFLTQFQTTISSEQELDNSLDVSRKAITDDGVLYTWVHGDVAYLLTKKGNVFGSIDGFNYDIKNIGEIENNIVRVNPGVITYLEYINR